MKEKFLVPVDGSDFATKALRYAVNLAEKVDAEIVLINVQPSLETHNIKRFISPEEIKEYQEEMAEEALNGALAVTNNFPNVKISTLVKIGSPEACICSVANSLGATSIIMGSRGLGAIKRALLGSVSYGVLHESKCPVTIVP